MPKYHRKYDPQDACFEQMAQGIVEQDPNQEKLRGTSNSAGDDALYQHRLTLRLTTVEAKFFRQSRTIGTREIRNLNDAAERNAEMYGWPSDRVLVTTAGRVSSGARALILETIKRGHAFTLYDYAALWALFLRMHASRSDLAVPLRAALHKKRSSGMC